MWKKEEIPEVLLLACLPRGSRAIKNSMMKRKNSLGTARRQYSKLIHQLSLGRAARKQETLLASQNKIIPLMITVTTHTKLLLMMGVKFPALRTHFEWISSHHWYKARKVILEVYNSHSHSDKTSQRTFHTESPWQWKAFPEHVYLSSGLWLTALPKWSTAWPITCCTSRWSAPKSTTEAKKTIPWHRTGSSW